MSKQSYRKLMVGVYLLLLVVLTLTQYDDIMANVSAIVVNDASGTAHIEDSLTVAFIVTDSVGNISVPDSIYVAIFAPDGDSTYAAAYILSATEIDFILVGGRQVFRWTEAVADIDAGGLGGTYSGAIVAVDTLDGTGSEYLDGAGFFSFVLEPRMADALALQPTTSGRTIDVTATGESGVDFSNINGTLDAGEIGADAITEAKIADNAIAAEHIAAAAIGASELATDAIGAAEIAANAITSSEIADNAIDAGAIAGDAITEAKIADNAIAAEHIAAAAIGASELATDAIGAAELAATAALEISDTAWDEILTGATHNINNSSGKILRQIKGGAIIHDGTSDNVPANGANAFSLETGGGSPTTSTIDDFYNHHRISIVSGTGEGQVVMISDYVGATQVATTTPAFLTTPDGTSIYEITPGLMHAETQGGGYSMGAVWVSPSGTAGTQLYVNGTIDNPIDDGSFADAKTVADALNITTFRIQTGCNITLATTYNNYSFDGTEWTLALGGQDLAFSTFRGADVTGIATGANIIEFFDCKFGAVQLPASDFFNCGFGLNLAATDSLLATGTGQYVFRNCYSLVSGTLTPTYAMGDAVGNTKFGFRGYDGGMELSEINSTGNDSISIEGLGNLILNATDIGGELVIRGNWTIDSAAGGSAVNLTRDAALSGEYIVDQTWDEVNIGSTHNVTNSTGRQLRDLATLGIIRDNTAQAGGTNVITLDASASATDGAYDPAGIFIYSGTGIGQTRLILEYDGTSKVAVVDRSWKMIPDATSKFIIFPDAGRGHVNEGMAQAGAVGTITLNALASASNDEYIGQLVFIRSGTGEDQVREVTAYNGTTKIATIRPNWSTTPDDSSGYVMLPRVDGTTDSVYAALDSLQNFPARVDLIWEYDSANVSGAQAMGTLIKDTIVYQGSASALTKEAIAREVWTIKGPDDTTYAAQTMGKDAEDWDATGAAGSGSNPMWFYTIDTSGTDDTVSLVSVTIFNAASSEVGGPQSTLATGATAQFNLPAGTLTHSALLSPNYVFPTGTFTSTANDTFAIQGYNIAIAAPANANLAAVFGTIRDIQGVGKQNVRVEAIRVARDTTNAGDTTNTGNPANTTDTNAGTIVSTQVVADSTDVNGYFQLDLLRTDQYDDPERGLYRISAFIKRLKIFEIDLLTVPPTGNLDISDSLAARF